jgi:hypothetical protein
MKMTLSKRVRAGFSLALLIVLTVFASFILANVGLFRSHLLPIVIGIAVAGLILLAASAIGPRSESPVAPDDEPPESYESEHPLAFFRNRSYWGGLLLASALPIFYFSQYLTAPHKPPPPPKVVQTPKPAAPTPVEFPDLKVEGYVLNGPHSTVVLNGRTVGVGEGVEGVKVIAIELWGVAIEMDGNRKWLSLTFAGANKPPRDDRR